MTIQVILPPLWGDELRKADEDGYDLARTLQDQCDSDDEFHEGNWWKTWDGEYQHQQEKFSMMDQGDARPVKAKKNGRR